MKGVRSAPPARARGVALLTALVVTALATAAAVAALSSVSLEARRTQNTVAAAQAWEHALGVEAWARGVLLREALAEAERAPAEEGERPEAAGPPVRRLPPETVEGGEVSGEILGLQGRFNLNSLLAQAKSSPAGGAGGAPGGEGSGDGAGAPDATSVPADPLSDGAEQPDPTQTPGTPTSGDDDSASIDSPTSPPGATAEDAGAESPAAGEAGRGVSAAGSGRVSEEGLARLRRLLLGLELDPSLANAIADWLDSDREVRVPGGAEDDHYLLAERPHRAGNGPFARLEELKQVRGVTPQVYATLAPHLVVLPPSAGLDVNTATPEALQTLAEGLDAGAVASLIGGRPYAGLSDFLSAPAFRNGPPSPDGLRVGTDFFEVRARVRLDRIELTLGSLLRREGAEAVRVVSRHRLGPWDA